MAKRFYFTTLASHPLTFSGHVFKFTVVGLSGGRPSGVYEAEDPQEILILDDVVRARRGVSAMSAEDYEKAKKKASLTPSSSNTTVTQPRVVRPAITPELGMGEKVGVLSAATKPIGSGPEDSAFRTSLDVRPKPSTLIRIARVNPPKPFTASDTKVKRASTRADRAKVRMVRRAEATP